MPDGSKVAYNPNSSTRQTITDRNGNYIEIIENATDSAYSNHKTTYLKDQLDRKVVIEYNAATDEDRVHSKGFNGETLTTRVIWKNIVVNKVYFACQAAPSPLDPDAWQNYSLNQSFRVVDKIYLPTQIDGNLFYEFDYNADGTTSTDTGWGEINQVTTPSGATSSYEYYFDGVSGGSNINAESVLLNRPIEKNLTYNNEYDGSSTSTTDTWVYTPTATGNDLSNLTSVTVTAPNGSSTTEHYTQDYDKKGEVYKTVMADGSLVEKMYATNAPSSAWAASPTSNRFVKYEFNTIADSGGSPSKTAINEYAQDKNGNTTEVKEYDFVAYSSIPRDGNGLITGLPSGISSYLKRITKTEFYNATPDSASTTYNDADSYHLASSERLLRLPSSAEVQDGSASPKSRSEFDYDFENYDSSNTKAGNLTSTKVWDSFKGGSSQSYSNPLTGTNSISTSATYNSYGMPLTSTDANGNDTVITYGNVTCPGGTVTDLYPTLTETAEGTAVERTSSAVYDCYTGLTTSATDEDNDVTTVMAYDDLGRPTIVKNAYGTTLESWVQTEYHDANRYVVTKADLEAEGDGKKVAVQHFDQMGRVRLSRTLENAATEDAANEQHGIKVQTRYATTYSSPNGYSYSLTSNPYRAATSSAASTEPTMGWTRSKAHHLGRHSEVETFSGATLPAPWGANSNSTGMVQTDIDANATTVTDQASKVRRSITNGLGQMIRVDEPTGAGLGTVGSPNQATNYTYDTLGNLLQVDQGSQDRIFTYSSLSRLRTANNPESGTITYAYDANGNLTSKVDARSITTSYVYDELNRVETRNYSDSTPDVIYTYDNKTNAYGKLTKVSSSVSATEYTAFDILGRVTSHKQTTDGNDYTTAYTYSLSGQLLEQTYPLGRVVKNTYDAADGSISQVQSKRSGETYRNFANGMIYNPAGAVTAMRLGNGKWENTVFNSRMQPTQIGLGNGVNSQNLLKVQYEYGATASVNNGNVTKQTITVPGVAHNFVQTYTYDELNRLSNAEEIKNSVQQWEQTFTYDRFGNRNFNEAETTTLPKNCGSSPNFTVCTADKKIVNPSVNTANNRLSTSDNYAFDNAGNTTGDAEGRTFVYDAENKQIEVIQSSVTIGEYFYDGDGKRIKKRVPAVGATPEEITIFVYDAGGKLIQEHSTIVQDVEDAKTVYTTNDHLGSPRINTDATGQVISRHDYHPFGEEVDRTSFSYGSDTIRKQFTGYERDGETGLDFAQARYFASGHGRFSSPDDFLNDSDVEDPQSWNKYVYGRNNPLYYVDPTGKKATVKITIDEKNKTAVIEISATIGIWTKSEQISEADMKKAAEMMQTNINEKWTANEAFIKDGITYSIKTNVTVTAVASEKEASNSQNSIEMTKGGFAGKGDGKFTQAEMYESSAWSSTDTGKMNIDRASTDTPGHEFGHLLGVDDQPGKMFMNTNPQQRARGLTAEDFDATFSSTIGTQIRDYNNGLKYYVGPSSRAPQNSSTYTFRTTAWWNRRL